MKKFVEKIELLDNVHQWAERDSIIKESVSQHSFKVATIALFILQRIEINQNSLKTDLKFLKFKTDVLSYAIMHDFDEAIFGRDISHVVKYNSYNGEHIRKAIDEYVEHILETEFSGLLVKPTYNVKRFVKLCDWLALLTFVTRNQNMGSKTFDSEDIYCREKIVETMNEVEEILSSEFQIKIGFLFENIKLEEL